MLNYGSVVSFLRKSQTNNLFTVYYSKYKNCTVLYTPFSVIL
jgi:hypothetical protein